MKRLFMVPALALTAVLLATACSNSGGAAAPTPAPAPAPAPTTTHMPPAATPPAPSPVATITNTNAKEVGYVKSVRPHIVTLIDALKKNDIPAAKAAYEGYDSTWNGTEIYIQFRDRPTYTDLETNWQAKIAEGLAAVQPNAALILPNAESLLVKYDEAIKMIENSKAMTPLFDDLAVVRSNRAPLRLTGPSLTANNMTKAKDTYTQFRSKWSQSKALFQIRSSSVVADVEASLTQVDKAWENPVATELSPLVATLVARYNVGVNLINGAAHGADLSLTTYIKENADAAALLSNASVKLKASLAAWESGTYADSGAKAMHISGDVFNGVSAPLKAKAADAALKTALDNYAALADKAGDAAKVRAANKTAVDAVAVAQQYLVGQFWADAKLQAVIAAK